MGYWWWVESAANPSPRLDSLLTGKKYTENVKFARRPRRLWISRYLIFESFYQIYSETDTSPNRELSPGIRELAFPDTSPKMRYVRKGGYTLKWIVAAKFAITMGESAFPFLGYMSKQLRNNQAPSSFQGASWPRA
jgi:hypothetical protein